MTLFFYQPYSPLIAPRITPHLRIQAANEICPHHSNAKTLSKFVVNAHFKCAERKQDKHKTIYDSCNLLISFTGIGGTIMIQTEKGQKEGLRMISDTETYIDLLLRYMHAHVPLKDERACLRWTLSMLHCL